MYSKELIKNVYKYDKEDQDNFFEDKKINYFDVFDTTKFNIFGSAVKDKKILLSTLSVRLYAHTAPEDTTEIDVPAPALDGATSELPQ